MIIGLPKETKIRENRVAGTPAAVRELVQEGASVFVEKGAGVGSGFSDEEYAQAGATVLSDRKKIYEQSDLVWKVKEPTAEEIPFYRKGQLLYTFLHLAASRSLTESLCKTGITAIAYEMVETADGALPILAPMSEAAGRIS
ncbi:MAG: alanine dehydrogenase, partial [bacterium]|nr:alanine dehydrogenase [bacterium]